MAIPLVVGIGLAALGAYKGGKAVIDNKEANRINDSANDIIETAKEQVENSRKQCQAALENLGRKKAETIESSVQKTLKVFGLIKNIDFRHDGDLGNLQLQENSFEVLTEMKEHVSFVLSSGLGASGGAVGGALTAYGAYSGVMALGTASTGTAIGSLSGAAATNATLAWLGGGTIATGGGGIAAGTMALGALAAGPALLVAGWYMGSKASAKLDDAYSNQAEAKKFADDMKAASALTNGIRKVAVMATDILSGLRKHARRSLKALEEVIAEQGTDYAAYNQEAKLIVMKNLKILQVIKVVVDTPILDKEGNLLGDASENLSKIRGVIVHDFQGALEG
ncbi:hypothetical protein [Neisseria animalis]|uniref:Chemotaxis protein n=1 Tax=Neisseria animalis TaxID=492 RepID=A0A5P3MSN1_NEIAN|nr:hypothetical protein [Neisseria animalis]QEY24612.1 hypothetical protein D0T90_09155 [Neisseria animalis]ROW32976.1 hypothetical protein CGZ60_01570 [Neisseria animalis]VEE07479.1 Uncharacterised protein [Neisseria animalis]